MGKDYPARLVRADYSSPRETLLCETRELFYTTSVARDNLLKEFLHSMNHPQLSIIVATYNRPPQLLQRAVDSALAQTVTDLEVIVIDDGSVEPVTLPERPRLRVIRLPMNRGISAVRNFAVTIAQGRWISYLDDDDELLPHFAEVSLQALASSTLPTPIAVLSGLDAIHPDGTLIRRHLPPTLPRGAYFGLERIEPQQSFFSKQTLVVEREVLLDIGGFDEAFSALPYTEMFLRLNPVCSLIGVPTVTYRQFIHHGPRLSSDPSRRQVDFHRLIDKHEPLFTTRPRLFAHFTLRHAHSLYNLGQYPAAIASVCTILRSHPSFTFTNIVSVLWRKLRWRRGFSLF